ncbi:MAG: PEGA domain-containing protein [Deltaproteobacteria bacterium]|nr:PEGA domain-containing protein [Deltaproteobacteria bacterium]
MAFFSMIAFTVVSKLALSSAPVEITLTSTSSIWGSDAKLIAQGKLKSRKKKKKNTNELKKENMANRTNNAQSQWYLKNRTLSKKKKNINKTPKLRDLPTKYRAVAVLAPQGVNIDFEIIHEIELSLINEIDETFGMRAISPADVNADMAAFDLDPEKCNYDPICLADAGRYAGAHMLLETRLAYFGGTLNIVVRIIDTESGIEVNRIAKSLADEQSKRSKQLHHLAVELLKPDFYVGSLKIECTQQKADVYIDDKLVGTTPLKNSLTSLKAGPHILHISKLGFVDIYQFVDVIYKRNSTIKVDLTKTNIVSVEVEQLESLAGTGELYIHIDEPYIELRIDGEPVAISPLSGPLIGIPAGTRRISLRKEGSEPLIQEIEVVDGKRTNIFIQRQGTTLAATGINLSDITSSTTDQTSTTENPSATTTITLAEENKTREPSWRYYSGLSLMGAGVVGILTGSVFAWRVSSLNNDAHDQVLNLRPLGNDVYSCFELSQQACIDKATKLQHLAKNQKTAQSIEKVSYIVGGSLLAIGATLYAWDYIRREQWPSWIPFVDKESTLIVAPMNDGATIQFYAPF